MNDDVKWITKGGKHIPLTNDYMNNKIRQRKEDIKVYRGGSNIGQLESGTFFSSRKQDAANYGEVEEYTIDKKAKLFEGRSSQEYAKENNLLDKKDELLKQRLGVDNLREIENIFYEWITPSYLNVNSNLYFFAYQYMVMKDLKSKGYDGAHWEWEDDLTPNQYQIWNKKIIKK